MAVKKFVVFAVYFAASDVEHAINSLINARFDAADISVWFSRSLASRELIATADYDSNQPQAAPTSYLEHLGVPTSEFNRYEDFIQKGEILLAVHCSTPHESDCARRIMKGSHSIDLASTSKP